MPEVMTKEGQKKKKKIEILQLHSNQKGKCVQFYLREEIQAYCADLNRLLRKYCLNFQNTFQELTWFCPLEQIATASACNRHLRLNRAELSSGGSRLIIPRPLWNFY